MYSWSYGNIVDLDGNWVIENSCDSEDMEHYSSYSPNGVALIPYGDGALYQALTSRDADELLDWTIYKVSEL